MRDKGNGKPIFHWPNEDIYLLLFCYCQHFPDDFDDCIMKRAKWINYEPTTQLFMNEPTNIYKFKIDETRPARKGIGAVEEQP